jgi:anion-transporting  ArsA/GET3 family ATPase
MCNAKERLSTMLGSDLIGPDVRPVAANVWAVNMEPARALEEYGLMTLKSRALYKLLFDNKYVRTFFRAVPGMQEWSLLGKAWWHTTETDADGRPKYDVVILDAPATGHGLEMLRVPKILVDVVPSGLLRRDAERAWQMLRDPAKCAVVLVTLPEEMPVTEALVMANTLQGELGLPIGKVVVNCMIPPLFERAERAVLEALPLARLGAAASVGAGEAALIAGRSRAIHERHQAAAIHRLVDELPVTPSYLPQLFEDAAHPKAIRELAKRLG